MIRKSNVHRKLVFWALVGSLMALPSLGLAQPGERGGQGRWHRGPGGPGGEMGILRELDLSQAQRDQLRSLFEEMRATGTMKRVAEARRALNDAVENLADDSEIQNLAYQLGEAEAAAAIERKQMQQKIENILTDEQRQKLAQARADRKARMEERRQRMEERLKQRRNN
jgi:protein CpxP